MLCLVREISEVSWIRVFTPEINLLHDIKACVHIFATEGATGSPTGGENRKPPVTPANPRPSLHQNDAGTDCMPQTRIRSTRISPNKSFLSDKEQNNDTANIDPATSVCNLRLYCTILACFEGQFEGGLRQRPPPSPPSQTTINPVYAAKKGTRMPPAAPPSGLSWP